MPLAVGLTTAAVKRGCQQSFCLLDSTSHRSQKSLCVQRFERHETQDSVPLGLAQKVSGDLNAFHDKGGPNQVARLRKVATVEGETSICHVTGRKVLSTYFGCPHNRFCFDVDKFLDPLDYVITNPVFGTFAGPLHTDTRFISAKAQEDAPIGARAPLVYASDHLPLIARINLTL